ncbi:MAG: cation diffusion facilitator family transporter [Pseudomonadota bacterium]|nr:cation diffusion facilitator family transporter [Pseudomonadota bacterium]
MSLGHQHDHHDHGAHASPATRGFALVLLINLAYTVLEAGYGFAINSLALLSDALHNLGDVLGLALAWGAATMAKRPPTLRHTYGWRRATLLSPLANALLLVGFAGALGWEAVQRIGAPPQVAALPVVVVAALGIGVNLLGAFLVRERHGVHDLNRRGAFLHLLADAAVSLAAVLAGLGMWWLGWAWLDPAVSLLIGAVVAISAFGLLRESFNAVMDAVPRSVDQRAVRGFLDRQEGVTSVHHLHIWSLGTGEVAMTAHLVRSADADNDAFLRQLDRELDLRFGINHATLQIEHGDVCGASGEDCGPRQ